MEKAAGLSLLTRDKSFFSYAKEFLQKKGFGSSRGPLALEKNLILGLELIKSNFNINPNAKNLYKNICVLRSPQALSWLAENKVNHNIIIGPNFSADEVSKINKQNPNLKLFLAASSHVKFTYINYGVSEEKIHIWPVGINTNLYKDFSQNKKNIDCLLYFKRRTEEELLEVQEMLKKYSQTYKVLSYGSYTEQDLINAARECKYAVILDGTESQGIAIESIMSCNLPLFVFDQIYLGFSPIESIRENLRSTSVPYWEDRCGMKVPTDTHRKSKNKFYDISESGSFFSDFLNKLPNYSPRSFITENLSLEKQASELINLF